MVRLDCRGLSCPLPVLRVKEHLGSGPSEPFCVIVDNAAAAENVSRFAATRGALVVQRQEGEDRVLTVTPSGKPATAPRDAAAVGASGAGAVLLFTRDRLGEGDAELGEALIKGFIHAVLEAPSLPSAIIFINRGIFLPTSGGQSAGDIASLEAKGVAVLACGTCLQHYGRKDYLSAGRVSNMYEITEVLLSASRVVTI